MQKISDHDIYFDRRFHGAFPAVIIVNKQELLLLFRRAPDHRHLAGAFGADVDAAKETADFDRVDHLDGRSHIAGLRLSIDLQPLEAVFMLPCDPEAADQDANLLRMPDGRLLQTGFTWRPVSRWIIPRLQELGVGVAGSATHHGIGYITWGGYARRSDDDGKSWSEHQYLPPLPGWADLVPGERPYYGGAVRGRPVMLADGTILQGTYAVRPHNGCGVALLHASRDGGESWEYRGIIAEDAAGAAGFLEPSLALADNGRLFAFHRTTGLDGRVAVSVSHDQGAHWSDWRALDAVGHPSDPCLLPDGRILLVYGRRHPPFGVRASLFDPQTETLTDDDEIIIRDDAPSPDVGYPWAVVLPDGKEVAVFYYIASPRGLRGIAASRLAIG